MTRLVHLSDLHFGTESSVVVGALERAVAALEPDVVAVSGDLTQRARRREFAAARRFLEALPGAHVVVPGNHDIPLFDPLARTLWPFRRYREAFGTTETSLFEHGGIRLIAANSVRPERHASGRVGRTRGREVSACARDAPSGSLTVVVIHHPLGSEDGEASSRRRRDVLADWKEAGVHLVLSGHEHRSFLFREESRSPWLLNAGTALSRRLRHDSPNSFNVVDVSARGDGGPGPAPGTTGTGSAAGAGLELDVARWDFDLASGAFLSRERRRVPL